MDLKQRKLNKSEWTSIEVPVSASEIAILNLIMEGYDNVNIKVNTTLSILAFLKLEVSDKMEDYIYSKYLRARGDKIEAELAAFDDKYKKLKLSSDMKINSGQKLRLDRFDETSIKKYDLYEFTLLNHMESIVANKKIANRSLFHYNYYTLYKLDKNNVSKVNVLVKELVSRTLILFEKDIDMSIVLENAVDFIEKNENLLKYSDLVLYEHQKEIFTICKHPKSKLILYMAPTGTGKTLTPIALSQQKKIIFVCAARHVGIALARAAISVKKKIAFAFGCASADDIRLHYFAAKEYTINRRTGGIGKVDNSIGTEVEIMICDIKSYLPAMYYMLAFFEANDIVMYWDEPTITLDYPEHEFHSTIRKIWKKNSIPNVVLSSATLPKQSDLCETVPDFLNKFHGAEIYNIVSHDCKKSIPIINKDGCVVLPHYLYDKYDRTLAVAKHCNDYLTLLRYFDLGGVVEFITYVNQQGFGTSKTRLERHFDTLDDVNMKNIKTYYIQLLQNILPEKWADIYSHLIEVRKPRIVENAGIDSKGVKITKSHSFGPIRSATNSLAGAPISRLASEPVSKTKQNITQQTGTSGVYVTTKDAHTLTDGPTIFISNDIEKIAKFCIQQANIPASVMDDIMKKIEYNNIINQKLHELESDIEVIREAADKQVKNSVSGFHGNQKVAGRNKSSKDPKKLSKDVPPEFENKGGLSRLTDQINTYRAMIKSATLNDTFVPNRRMHLDRWAEGFDANGAFTSSIDEHIVSDIMALNGVENTWKVLLMMGIGVFINHENITYTEIMKRLADEQRLYMIIASSDYIYGTNYQFCHGFLSKDLNLTQEKLIQAMGRIGRNNIQQTYTVRFRDDEQIMKLFTSETDKPEIINMNRLFNTRKVVWQNDMYVEIDDDIADEFAEEVEDQNGEFDPYDN
ncbi:MAG: hypothetical protein MUP82_06420 [Candidatus Marinimicrobia bacterium]|nr:hypothetical protein [Candidatus Neomarinimicrobiota bacterium]